MHPVEGPVPEKILLKDHGKGPGWSRGKREKEEAAENNFGLTATPLSIRGTVGGRGGG